MYKTTIIYKKDKVNIANHRMISRYISKILWTKI